LWVPAEIGHAPYAAPLLEYLVRNFDHVQIIAVRDKLFPELSQDCWLLYAEGFAGQTHELRFTVLDRFEPTSHPPKVDLAVAVKEWRAVWKRRLRPYLMPAIARELYQLAAAHPESRRLGDIAQIGIGYVSGDNEYFHLRSSTAARWGIPAALLHPTVRNGRVLPSRCLTAARVEAWRRADDPIFLLRLPKTKEVPASVRRYLDTEDGHRAREAYKCRARDPWYSVPDVQVPDFFLTYMSGVTASLVRNAANCTCTNSVHSVRIREKKAVGHLLEAWTTPFARLSCEIEGHPLGGGMLKLEPREAAQIVLPALCLLPGLSKLAIIQAVSTMRRWRHHAGDN